MALPVVSTPTFTTVVPSTGEQIEYRPFLVKEEKTLLIALEGKEPSDIARAVSNLLSDCILSNIDVSKLATFDIEYLFLVLRGKSVGEVITVSIGHTDSECTHKTEVQINIDDIKVQGEVKDKKIMLNDKLGVMLKYPNIDAVSRGDMDTAEEVFKFIADHIDYVFDDETVYNDFSKQEINDWIGTLNQNQFQMISNWYADMPSLKHTVTFTCPQCDEDETIILEGLQSFFT